MLPCSHPWEEIIVAEAAVAVKTVVRKSQFIPTTQFWIECKNV